MVSSWKTIGATFVSLFLSATVIANAFHQKKQFYPSVVHITNSSPSMAVLYIQGFVIAWLISQVANKIFFGKLLDSEVEHVVDEFWYAVPETCLLFAAFREDLTPLFVVSLTTLFLIKAFHWLADVRIDFMERSPLITKKFHIRAVFLLIVLVSSDCFMMSRSIRGVMSTGPSVQMVYALEYAVLLLLALDVLGKYILHCIDRQSDNPWENKPIYKSYLEVVLGFFKVSAYFGFMLFMARVHIFPLYITRRLFVATKSFKKSIEDVIKSRRAIHNLNNLFPDVTPEQLEGRDNTCMVCREEMAQNCKMLPCGHIFHTACLRSWFQRQQVCPTCTASVLMTTRAQQVMMQQQNNRLRQQREQQQQQNEPQPGVGPVHPIFPQGLPGWIPPHPRGEVPPQEPPQPEPTSEEAGVSTDGPGQVQDGEETAQPLKPETFPTPSTGGPTSYEEWLSSATKGGENLSLPFVDTASGGAFPGSFLPPIPPHFKPFGATIPDPNSLKLNMLNEEELQALEGSERENVEARIGVLRNIQLLLDSAVVQMNQYYVATGNLPFQDSLLLTDVSRTAKKPEKKRSSVKQPSSSTTTQHTSKSFEGGIGRSVTWSPSVTSTPSVFSSLLEKGEEESEELQFAVSESVELQRSISTPPSSDAELRQRRLERLESLNKSTDILEQPQENSTLSAADTGPPTEEDRD